MKHASLRHYVARYLRCLANTYYFDTPSIYFNFIQWMCKINKSEFLLYFLVYIFQKCTLKTNRAIILKQVFKPIVRAVNAST